VSVGVQQVARNIERCEKEISRCAGQPPDSSEAETHQRLSRNPVAEGALEPLAYSAEEVADRGRRLNLIAGSITVQNIESRGNQLKLGHPPQVCGLRDAYNLGEDWVSDIFMVAKPGANYRHERKLSNGFDAQEA
jgi:hypothetical protein